MKFPFLPTILIPLALTACSSSVQTDHYAKPTNTSAFEPVAMGERSVGNASFESAGQNGVNSSYLASTENRRMNKSSVEKVWHPINDAKTGKISAHIPMPSDWQLRKATQDDPSNLVGPHGIKGYSYAGQNYAFSTDPYMQQSYQAAGQQMRRPVGVEVLVEREFIPEVEKQGVRVTKKYPIPSIAEMDRQYNSQLYGADQVRSDFSAHAVEWVDKDGKPSITIVRYSERSSQGFMIWGYHVDAMEADPAYFEQAKADYIYACANTRHDPQHIAQFNASEQAKSQQSWAQHNQRMAQNQRNFDASQQAYRTRQSASDIQMQGWKDRNAIQEQGHSIYINSINEQTTVQDPNNGQYYNVEAGANQTWMNGNGEYIQSDDYFYDPNMDSGVDQYNWESVDDLE